MVGVIATKPTFLSSARSPPGVKSLPLTIWSILAGPFLSFIIVHTPRLISISFLNAIISPSSSIQLLGLSGRGRASPFILLAFSGLLLFRGLLDSTARAYEEVTAQKVAIREDVDGRNWLSVYVFVSLLSQKAEGRQG